MGSLIVAVLILVLLVAFFYKSNDKDDGAQQEEEIIAKLKARYRAALKAGDKASALKYGRDYYAYLRNSRSLTAADEQAIERDLANMPQVR